MAMVQVMIGGVVSIIFYAVVLGAVYKLFQIHWELGEIKEVLKDIRRNTENVPAPTMGLSRSPENLMHAISAASYQDETEPEPAADPER